MGASSRMPTDLGRSTVSDRWRRLPSAIQRIADIGASQSDDEELRLQRRAPGVGFLDKIGRSGS